MLTDQALELAFLVAERLTTGLAAGFKTDIRAIGGAVVPVAVARFVLAKVAGAAEAAFEQRDRQAGLRVPLAPGPAQAVWSPYRWLKFCQEESELQ